MLLKREGYPEDGELVWCTVTKIHYHSVFCQLEEYDKQGMIHISEVSPGRIRNISDYVKEGKPIVCKVLNIDEKKGHIDLSLRRVSDGQRRKKANEIKQEKKAEKILESAAKQLKTTIEKIYPQVKKAIFKEYDYLHPAFEEVVENNLSLKNLGVEEKVAKVLEEVIREKIKPKEVTITGKMTIKTYEPDGIEIIKSIIKNMGEENVTISYAGGGSYRLSIKAKEFKNAEAQLKKVIDLGEKNKKIIFKFSKDK